MKIEFGIWDISEKGIKFIPFKKEESNKE